MERALIKELYGSHNLFSNEWKKSQFVFFLNIKEVGKTIKIRNLYWSKEGERIRRPGVLQKVDNYNYYCVFLSTKPGLNKPRFYFQDNCTVLSTHSICGKSYDKESYVFVYKGVMIHKLNANYVNKWWNEKKILECGNCKIDLTIWGDN